MSASSTVENYLKAILHAQGALAPDALVPMGQVAAALGVAPGTATTMVKTLAESGLARYEPYAGVRLTAAGEKLAALVLRRHRLIELFLVKVLGMSWTEVHDEAEQLEHAVSDRLIDRIDDMLGRPSVDPHGDPIPDPDGLVAMAQYDSLLTCAQQHPVRVQRVTDQSPDFLRFIERNGLRPGQHLQVDDRDDAADSVHLRLDDGRTCTIGARAASKILVHAVALLLLVLGSLGAVPVAAAQAPARSAAAPFEITDNSFLVEEAFNQEPGVVQHIAAFTRAGGSWAATFTQEWPVASHAHQLSYTVSLTDAGGGTGMGDSLVNYRYQVWDEAPGRPAFAPRASLVLPTGSVERSRGLGSYGLQINLPFSKQTGDLYWHWNAGLTWLPDADPAGRAEEPGEPHANLTVPFLAGSAIYRVHPMLNAMLESLVVFDADFDGLFVRHDNVVTLSPGVRGGWNIGKSQIVTGAAIPVTWSGGTTDTGILLYFSYEGPLGRR